MPEKIVFIDGYCVMCDGLAKYILKYDKHKAISVASLQGETAKSVLDTQKLIDLNTVYYQRGKALYDKSSAVIYIFSDLGGWRSVAKVFIILPKFFRDWAYSCVATRRYKWFGKKEVCELPNSNTEKRILS